MRRERAEIIHDRRICGIPDLIVEILSPSNPEQDAEIKLRAYARARVPEYWIVRADTRDVLLCWQPDLAGGDYAQTRLIAPNGELVSPTLPLRVTVADLFAGAHDSAL